MVPGGRPGGYPPARLYVSHSADNSGRLVRVGTDARV